MTVAPQIAAAGAGGLAGLGAAGGGGTTASVGATAGNVGVAGTTGFGGASGLAGATAIGAAGTAANIAGAAAVAGAGAAGTSGGDVTTPPPPACANPKVACMNGMAGAYTCSGVDMLARIPVADFGARAGNAIWGGTESKNHRDIAVVGLDNGAGFVDVTSPGCPVLLGVMPSTASRSPSRDVKVMGDFALVGAEIQNHGIQILDMKTLPMMKSTSMLMPTMVYRGPSNATITNSHNIVISEKAGFVYIVGSKTCNGGLHAIDFHDPMNPKYVGCAYDDFYVHDAECVIYNGPDKEHAGREICVTYNGQDGFSVVDVQDKMAPKVLSHTEYGGSAYTHNGGFTMDQSHILLSDELDESRNGHPTRTYLFDLTDLDKPVAMPPYDHKTKCVDHNLYIKGNFAFQANYECGLHILDVSGVGAGGTLKEVAFFDTFPNLDAAEMKGSWTAFPYFKSGAIVMNGTEGGFFVLQPQADVLGQPK